MGRKVVKYAGSIVSYPGRLFGDDLTKNTQIAHCLTWPFKDPGPFPPKDTASYQRDVYRITQPLGAFFFIHHTVLSLVESKGKWKWRKAQLMSHGMRGSF